MAFKHMALAMNSLVGDPLAKLLLIALADRADKETNQCWPSYARLCQDTEMSMATITRKLSYLEEHSFIYRTKRKNTSTLYTLRVSNTDADVERSDTHTEHSSTLPVSIEPTNVNLPIEPIKELTVMYDCDFDDFWSVYPRKIAKSTARRAYDSAMKKATADEVLSAVKIFSANSRSTEKQYIPHPSTWLNGERWLDDVADETWGGLNEL